MTKFAILSGAYKNAGDFLIVKRCKEIIRYVYPQCEFVEFERRKLLGEKLQEVNQCDFLVIAGGPAYRRDLYPAIMPLIFDLNDITIPIITMGVGQKCIEYSPEIIGNYQFTEKTMELMEKIQSSGNPFSCRDWASVELLQCNGFQNTVMTGCTAWYDIENIDNCECNIHSESEIKTVYISDPALPDNYSQVPLIIDWLKTIIPEIIIKVIFHRGIDEDSNTDKKTARKIKKLLQVLEEKQVQYIDISYGADGFKDYEECDLHIGYRVHAHIYNMSMRKASILIQEDSRGGGIDDALGIRSIKAYDEKHNLAMRSIASKFSILDRFYRNKNLIYELNAYLERLNSTKFRELEYAYKRMQETFQVMVKYVRGWEKPYGY